VRWRGHIIKKIIKKYKKIIKIYKKIIKIYKKIIKIYKKIIKNNKKYIKKYGRIIIQPGVCDRYVRWMGHISKYGRYLTVGSYISKVLYRHKEI